MKTWNRFFRAGISLLGMTVVAAFIASSASAQINTILATQSFSSSMPSGWTNSSGAWSWESIGDGGSNGSLQCDDWDYYSSPDPLITPSFNVSNYAKNADSVWVDFDFFWEDCGYVADGADTWKVLANSDAIQTGTESTLGTWINTSDYNWDNYQSSSTYWVHYHLLVPVADRTSSMTITFNVISGFGCSNPLIDNVAITGKLVAPSELSLQTNPPTTPKKMDFGVATPSSAVTLCATVKSVGTAALHFVGNGGLSGSSAYSIVSGPKVGDSLTPGNTAQYCIQFQPFTSGTLTGIFTAYTDGGDSGQQSISLTGIGSVPNVSYNGLTTMFHGVKIPLGDTSAVQYVTVTSNGVGPLTFNGIYFIGLDPTNYIITRTPQNPLPSGVTDSIGIKFTPNVEGRPDASIVINTTAANLPIDTITLFGIGTLAHLVISLPDPSTGNTLEFDSVALGDSVCQTMTLTNTGSDTLRILNQLLTYGDYDFSFYPLTGADTMLLPGGGEKLVNVCFKPLKNGSREASIRFYTNIRPTFTSPPKDTSQFVINVTGIGVPYGILEVTGPVIDTAQVGKSNCVVDTFENAGLAELTVSNATISGPNSSAFTITSGAPIDLMPGQKSPVTICYTAAASGASIDTIIANGVTSEHNFSNAVVFTGFGANICASAAPNALTFGGLTLANTTAMDTVTITNCGDYASTYTGAVTAGGTTYSVPATPLGPITAGGTGQFVVTFAPAAIGAATGNLEITGTEGPVAPVEIALNGVGAGVIASASGSPASAVALGACDTFTVTIANTGNYSWTPGSGVVGGTNASDFTILSGPTPAVIPANGTGTLMVEFCPGQAGTRDMTLTFPNGSPTPIPPLNYSVSGVGATSGIAIKAEQDGFVLGQSFPNPTNGSAEVTFTLPHDAPIGILLMDLTGHTVQTVFTGNMPSGDHSLPMKVSALPSGTYYYTLTSGDVRLTRQMTIVK